MNEDEMDMLYGPLPVPLPLSIVPPTLVDPSDPCKFAPAAAVAAPQPRTRSERKAQNNGPSPRKRQQKIDSVAAAAPTKKKAKVTAKKSLDDTTTNAAAKTKKEKFTWSDMFFQLVLYRARNGGSCDVPKGYSIEVGGKEQSTVDGGPPGSGKRRARVRLGAWVREMRSHRRALDNNVNRASSKSATVPDASSPSTSDHRERKAAERSASVLTPERILALDGLDFQWDAPRANPRSFRHDLWQDRYGCLKDFFDEHGHSDVPKEHLVLYRWCNNQRDLNAEVSGTKVDMGPSARRCAGWAEELSSERKKRISGKQTPEFKEVWSLRKAKLDELGFVWRKRDRVSWEDRLEQLKQYKAEFGDCQVPQFYKDNRQLGKWVNKIRTEYKYLRQGKKSSMTEERIALLEAIDFQWNNGVRGRPPVPISLPEDEECHDGRDDV